MSCFSIARMDVTIDLLVCWSVSHFATLTDTKFTDFSLILLFSTISRKLRLKWFKLLDWLSQYLLYKHPEWLIQCQNHCRINVFLLKLIQTFSAVLKKSRPMCEFTLLVWLCVGVIYSFFSFMCHHRHWEISLNLIQIVSEISPLKWD